MSNSNENATDPFADGGMLPALNYPGESTAATASNSRQAFTAGRFATLNTFVDRTMRDLTSAQVKTWLAIYRDCKADGTCRTAQSDLARRAGVDVRTVQRALAALRKRGLVDVVRRGSPDGGPSTYRVRATRSRQFGAKGHGKSVQKVPA